MSAKDRPKRSNPPSAGSADRKRRFRETARDILHMAKVKHQYGGATDTAGALARAMEQAYKLGFNDALKEPQAPEDLTEAPSHPDALPWTLIPARTRRTFWSICLAALGREGHTSTQSYLEALPARNGRLTWQLVVPDPAPMRRAWATARSRHSFGWGSSITARIPRHPDRVRHQDLESLL